ncbi:MepB family protein [Paenimyroides ceti]
MNTTTLYPNFEFFRSCILEHGGPDLQEIAFDSESKAYEACEFLLNKRRIRFRAAKTTPKKSGQFVTIWKRNPESGVTMPWEKSDAIDFALLFCADAHKKGFLLLPEFVLEKQGLIATAQNKGKRGFRIYAPWDIATNAQAKKTKAWQLPFFIECTANSFTTLFDHLK